MLDIDQNRLEHFLRQQEDGPVIMLNLLRFDPDGGAAKYAEYLDVAQGVGAEFGLEALFVGTAAPALAAEDGQSWDAAALIRYPSRQAFADMIASADYQAIDHLRKAGLLEAVLQPFNPMDG